MPSSADARTASPNAPRPEDFPHRTIERIRFGDLDVNGHVNNAVFSTFFEAGRVTLFRPAERGLMPAGFIWTLARIEIDYKAEMHWPGDVEVGIGVERLGRSSATFAQALFFAGRCAAVARAVNVLVGLNERKAAPIPEEIRRNFEVWKIRAPGG